MEKAAMNRAEVPEPPIDIKTVKRVWWVCPHKTGDSFMLMLYASKDRSVTEYIWNSREGVTPFIVMSRDGKTELQHEAWDRDIYCPTFRPPKGMRIFVNLTREKAAEHARRVVEKAWDHPQYPMKDSYDSKDEAVKAMTEEYYNSFGAGTTPDIVEVDDAWLAAAERA